MKTHKEASDEATNKMFAQIILFSYLIFRYNSLSIFLIQIQN